MGGIEILVPEDIEVYVAGIEPVCNPRDNDSLTTTEPAGACLNLTRLAACWLPLPGDLLVLADMLKISAVQT